MNNEKPYMPVDEPEIGRVYHLSWAYHNCHWELIEINGDEVVLQTKRGKKITSKKSDLRYTRLDEKRAISKLNNTPQANH